MHHLHRRDRRHRPPARGRFQRRDGRRQRRARADVEPDPHRNGRFRAVFNSNSELDRIFFQLPIFSKSVLTFRKPISENQKYSLRKLRKFESLGEVDLFRKNCLNSQKHNEFWTVVAKN